MEGVCHDTKAYPRKLRYATPTRFASSSEATMDKKTLIRAAQFTLERAGRYTGRDSEFRLDALFYSHVRTTHPSFDRQYQIGGSRRTPKRIDFINKTTNPAVIELAHRKRGKSMGFSPRANSPELDKLSKQIDKKWRYLLILDPSPKPLDKGWLLSQYGAYTLKGRPPKRKSVRIVYVHKDPENTFDFLWRPTSSL